MERVCKRCGKVYRGLVCHACHPRLRCRRRTDRADCDGLNPMVPTPHVGAGPVECGETGDSERVSVTGGADERG